MLQRAADEPDDDDARDFEEWRQWFASYLHERPALAHELYHLGSADRRSGLWTALRDTWQAARHCQS